MDADILLSILQHWLEVEILYQKNRKLEDMENEEYQQGYIQALVNIDAVLRGDK